MQVATTTQPTEVVTPPQAESSIMSVDSDRFAKIAAREAKFVKERETFKSEQQKLYEEKQALASVKTQLDEFEALRSKDPIAALKKLGFSETDVFNFISSKEEPTIEQIATQRAEELMKQEFEKRDKVQAEKEAAASKEREDRAINGFKETISSSIKKDAEKYEYCAYEGAEAEGIIYETVLEIIKEEPDILPHKAMQEAIELTEKYYEEKDLEMAKLKKRQPKVEAPVVEEKKVVRTRTPDKVSAPTLTAKATATAASTIPKGETSSQKRARLENWLRNGKPS